MNIRFLFNFLFIDGCKEILFPLGIRGLIQLEELVIVFIYGSNEEEMSRLSSRNIYAYNKKGQLIWQVQEPIQATSCVVSYADISLRDNGDIVAGSTQGDEYIVNILDGSVKHVKGRRPW